MKNESWDSRTSERARLREEYPSVCHSAALEKRNWICLSWLFLCFGDIDFVPMPIETYANLSGIELHSLCLRWKFLRGAESAIGSSLERDALRVLRLHCRRHGLAREMAPNWLFFFFFGFLGYANMCREWRTLARIRRSFRICRFHRLESLFSVSLSPHGPRDPKREHLTAYQLERQTKFYF